MKTTSSARNNKHRDSFKDNVTIMRSIVDADSNLKVRGRRTNYTSLSSEQLQEKFYDFLEYREVKIDLLPRKEINLPGFHSTVIRNIGWFIFSGNGSPEGLAYQLLEAYRVRAFYNLDKALNDIPTILIINTGVIPDTSFNVWVASLKIGEFYLADVDHIYDYLQQLVRRYIAQNQ